jgi:predicted DNA-binding transcriptional regulator AlpA
MSNNQPQSTECMRAGDAARYLALSPSTLAKMRLRGDGPRYVKAGPRAVTYRRADLDAWLESHARHSTSECSATSDLPKGRPGAFRRTT